MHPESKPAAPPPASQQAQDEPMDELPKMTAEIDAYLSELVATVETAELRNTVNVRTTSYTETNFEATKRDRLWAMKSAGQFVDSIMVTPDGYREVCIH